MACCGLHVLVVKQLLRVGANSCRTITDSHLPSFVIWPQLICSCQGHLGAAYDRAWVPTSRESGAAGRVDLVWQLLLGLISLIGVALLVEEFEDLVFGDLHGASFR